MARELLLGNEAVARGAIDAGINGAYAYPGTPSTEAIDYAVAFSNGIASGAIQGRPQFVATYPSNEKTSLEIAAGMSHAGGRSFVSMKHVGLNVAADPFMSLALTGVHGGLVMLVCDDPGMHSSQSEQDSRFYAFAAGVPVLEPRNPQEAYDMTREAYRLSEKHNTLVMVRVPTRLAHSRTAVNLVDVPQEQNNLDPKGHDGSFMLLPHIARRSYDDLLRHKIPRLEQISAASTYNPLEINPSAMLGIITSGLADTYVRENISAEMRDSYSYLTIGMPFPLPTEKIRELARSVDRLLIVEEGQPIIEERIKAMLQNNQVEVMGRLSGHIPRTGELTPESIRKALGMDPLRTASIHVDDLMVNRPPRLCDGCPHIPSYLALNAARRSLDGHGAPFTESRVYSDIGCYTLGFAPPFESIDTTLEMGASIPMAIGASDMGLNFPVAVIGDSTYAHSGQTGLLDAALRELRSRGNAPITIMILDNSVAAMTGSQPSLGTDGRVLEAIISTVGKDHVHVIDPHQSRHDENVSTIKDAMEYRGTSVVIAKRPCLRARKGELTYVQPPDLETADHPSAELSRNIILAGVGGQGILSMATVLDLSALVAGYHFNQSEVHGMSQRGGSVYSHLRFADSPIPCGLIPLGAADLIIGVEPLEALRYVGWLKPDGVIVTSLNPIQNTPYDHEAVVARLRSYPQASVVDAERLAKDAGSSRASNIVILGTASRHLGLPDELVRRQIREIFAPKGQRVVDANIRAFDLGQAANSTG